MDPRLALFTMALAVASMQVAARADADTLGIYRDWALTCSGDDCRLAQTLMSPDRIWIATVMLYPRGEGSRLAEVFVPPGVHFPSGLFVTTAGDRPLRGDWIRCSATACESMLRLDARAEAQWRAGAVAELRFRPSPQAPVAMADISLMGVSAGLAALDEVARDGRSNGGDG